MTIDEALEQIEEIAEDNQKVVDTHRISDELTIDEIYCDDTEIIEERLAVIQKRADDFRQLAEWLKDYKRLKEQEPILDKIRAEIAEYGSIRVAYAITDKTKTDEGIKKLVSDVLKQAKEQVLDIIDKYKEESEDKECTRKA